MVSARWWDGFLADLLCSSHCSALLLGTCVVSVVSWAGGWGTGAECAVMVPAGAVHILGAEACVRVGGGDSPGLPPGGQLLQVSWRKQVADICQVAEVTLAGRGGPASPAVLRAVSSSCWLSSLHG